MKGKKSSANLFTVFLTFLFLTACGGGGGGGDSTDNNNTDNPPPADTLPTVKDTAWTQLNRSPIINKMLYTGSKYIAVGKYGFIGSTTDAQSWTEYDGGTAVEFTDLAIAPNGTNMIAIPRSNTGILALTVTTDGTNWQYYDYSTSINCAEALDIIHDGSQFVGIFIGNGGGAICTSADGTSWQLQTTLNGFTPRQLAYGNSLYAFSLEGGGLITKTVLNDTATTVATFPVGSSVTLQDMVYANSAFVGYSLSGGLYYSTDGNSWSGVNSSAVVYGIQALSYSADKGFVAVNGSFAYSSNDGINWTVSGGTNQPVTDIINFDYIANGSTETFMFDGSGRFYNSSDLSVWTQTSAKPLLNASAFLSQNGVLHYAAGDLYRSIDNGSNWTVVDTQIGGASDIIHDGTRFIVSGTGLAYSADGINWMPSLLNRSYLAPTVSARAGTTTHYLISNYIGSSGYQNLAMSSDDGINFQIDNGLINAISSAGGITGRVKQAVSNGSVVIAISDNDIISYNASVTNTWAVEASSPNTLNKIAWTGSEFIIVGAAGTVMTSTDGQAWTTQTWVNAVSNISDVTSIGSTLYALDSARYITSSANGGVDWTVLKDLGKSGLSAMYIAANTDSNDLFVFGQSSSGAATMVYTGISWSAVLPATDIVAGPVIYESANQRFLSLSSGGTNMVLASSLGNTWTVTSSPVTEPAFAYIYAASNLGKANFGPIQFTAGSPNSYATGFAYSTDGQNWSLNASQIPYPGYTPVTGTYAKIIGAGISTSTDGINFSAATITGMASSTPNIWYMKYVNSQYVAITINPDSNGAPGRGVYTSANGSDWTLITEISADSSSQWSGQVSDIEYDGNQYLFLFYDQTKGAMIMTSPDLQNFTVHETGIKSGATDLVIENSGFRIIGGDGVIATHAAY